MEIIIQEIQYWKENKLLPDEYCDYLLALYTKGNTKVLAQQKRKRKTLKTVTILRICLILLMLLLTITIYFLNLDRLMETALLVSCLFFSTWMYLLLRNQQLNTPQITVVMLALYLIASMIFSTSFFQHRVALYIVFMIHFSFWYFLSKRMNLTFLKIVSILSTSILAFYLIYQFFLA